ncbi:branched-chain amino acid ABC transporter substrate-binding protein [Aerophototrophica crusticola]|uniref:Branched-chain amino acid ABC transporter substrate-binding protein n=1 Tax=Aerophototrophica crusticola TaxID=1709002 RepID=A0A858R5R1_9PROT|nr:branched-chain amino acid ABC transporter substrate-binding protein [Rhodospirillaceae bacterium B3]
MRTLLAAAAMALAVSSAHAEIVIGSAGPLTGPLAAVGEQLRRGTEQAAADLNAAGGVLGQKITVAVHDDAGVPTQAVAVANKLATQGARMVVGHLQSGTSIPASQVYGDEGIIMITPTATAPELTDSGSDLVFRTCGRDDQQGPIAAQWLVENFAGKRVALVQDQTTYGKGLADATKAAMNAKGLKEVLYTAITGGERDFSALVTRLKAENVDALYFGGYYADAGVFVRQMREAGVTAAFLSGDTLASNEFWTLAGKAGEGAMMTFSADARSQPAAQEVIARFRAKGQEPDAYTLYAYAAVQAWATAAEKAKSLDGPKVAKAMREGKYDTAIGALSFDKKGDRTDTDYVLYRWSDGKFAPIAQK